MLFAVRVLNATNLFITLFHPETLSARLGVVDGITLRLEIEF